MGRIDLTDEEFKELMETLDEDNSNEVDCEAHFPRFDVFDVSSTLQEASFSSCPFCGQMPGILVAISGLEWGCFVQTMSSRIPG